MLKIFVGIKGCDDLPIGTQYPAACGGVLYFRDYLLVEISSFSGFSVQSDWAYMILNSLSSYENSSNDKV